MREKNFSIRVCSFFILLLMLFIGPVSAFGNWGMEVGRANDEDVVNLLTDWTTMDMAQRRIKSVLLQPLMRERQRQLIGLPDSADGEVSIDDVVEWWIKNVASRAQLIAKNPAASCAQAEMSVNIFLAIMREKSMFGIDDSDSGKGAEIGRMGDETVAFALQRCRDEALDECVATGRYSQIIERGIGEATQSDRYNIDIPDPDAWAEDALRQCAIYELQFVSTSKIDSGGIIVERVLKGTLDMQLEPGKFKVANLVLYGQTRGDLVNLSLKCAMPAVQVTCSPGKEIVGGFKAWIRKMDLKHREYFVDSRGISQVRTVGEDKLPMELAGDAMMVKMNIVIPKGPPVPAFDFPAGGMAFTIAHKKDAIIVGGSNVRFERSSRGVYPTIFEFTYADQDKLSSISGWDSTVLKLVHKPKPKPFAPRPPEPVRKPLKSPVISRG